MNFLINKNLSFFKLSNKSMKNMIFLKERISLYNITQFFMNTNTLNNKNKNRVQVDLDNITRKLNSVYRFQETKSQFKKENEKLDEEESLNNNENENNTSKSSTDKAKETESGVKKFVKSFVALWKKTFPGETDYSKLMVEKMEEAKILKSKIKYAGEEEIESIYSTIKEWKHKAVILLQEVVETEKKRSILDIYSQEIYKQINESKTYEKVKQTNTYKEYEQFKEDLGVIKSNIRDNIAMSYNPAVIVAKDLVVSILFLKLY